MSFTRGRRAIFIDLDGTILTSRGRLPDSARDAIGALRRAGHLVTLSTGRSITQLPGFIRDLGFDAVVTGEGAHAELADGTILAHQDFDPDAVRAVAGVLAAGSVPFFFETHEQLVVPMAMMARVRDALLGSRPEQDAAVAAKQLDALLRPWREDGPPPRVTKVVYLGAHSAYSGPLPAGVRIVPTSIPSLFGHVWDLVQSDVHKAAAMAQVLAHFGLSAADAVAVGDGHNDIEMLRAAGVGVAMGNAGVATKFAADVVAPPADEDGLARVLNQLGLLAPAP